MKSHALPALLTAELIIGSVCFEAKAQAPAELSIQTYAGLTITGPVGTVYSIEHISDLAQTNDSSAWRCVEFLRLPSSPFLWIDKSKPVTDTRFYRATEFSVPTNMVFIPPGTFRLGSPESEEGRLPWEGPQTAVTISRGYWMGKYKVTQGTYLELMGHNPSAYNGQQGEADFGVDLNRPVETVSWFDAIAYCAALTERENSAGRIPAGSVFRLPTEAEWEYACRAWTSTRFSYGDDPGYSNLTNYVWHWEHVGGATYPVGQKLPNLWGLYDLHGNVREWCQDWWSDRFPGGVAIDPLGPATGSERVLRGGRWSQLLSSGRYCRTAYRVSLRPGTKYSDCGFRVVLSSSHP